MNLQVNLPRCLNMDSKWKGMSYIRESDASSSTVLPMLPANLRTRKR